jgi:hypothetical protein
MTVELAGIHNQGYDFVRQAPPHIRLEFKGVPRKILLNEGETLFRFMEARFRVIAYDFWLPLETYHQLRRSKKVPAWAIWKNAGAPAKVVPATFCSATLKRKVYGFKGLSASAGKKAVSLKSLTAAGLVWIPELSTQDIFVRNYSL